MGDRHARLPLMTDLHIRPLRPTDRIAVEELFADDGGYAQRVHGRAATSADVHNLFNARPAECTVEQKHTMGLFAEHDLVGVADLLIDFPEVGTNYLGLLQIRADHQGQGLAAQFHRELTAMFDSGRVWRLSVVDSNREVIGFWHRMGYALTGETRQWTSTSGASRAALIMERAV